MKIVITDQALAIMKDEWGYGEGDFVRIYARYASGGSEPFVLSIYKEQRQDVEQGIHTAAGGITFFMKQDDLWILDEHDLVIDANGDEIVFVRQS